MNCGFLARWPIGLRAGVVVSALAILHFVWPVLAAPATRMIGDLQTEIASHAPPLAASLVGLSRFGPFVRAEHPVLADAAMAAALEPTTVLAMTPAFRIAGGGTRGFALGWNTWHMLVVLASAAGAAIGAKAVLGEKDVGGFGAGLAMVAGASSLFLHRFADAGRTEAQDYGFYALHVGLVLWAARRPGGGWGAGPAWALAAVALVPTLWAGGYAAIFVAFTEPLLALWALSIAGSRRTTVFGLVGVAALSAAAIAPLVWALQTFPYVGVVGRSSAHRVASFDLSLLLTDGFTPGRDLPGYEAAPFVGWVLLTAAIVGAVRGGWNARFAAGIGLFCLWEAAGPEPTLFGNRAWGPTSAWVALGGPFALVRGWARIIAFAVPFLAIAAGVAVAGRARFAVLAMVALLAEMAGRSPQRWWSLELPATVETPAVGSLVLPIDTWAVTRRWLSPAASPDPLQLAPDRPLLAWFALVIPQEPVRMRNRFRADAPVVDPCVLVLDGVALRADGYSSLRAREGFLSEGAAEAIEAALTPVFGARVDGGWVLPLTAGACAEGSHIWQPESEIRPRAPAERAAARAADRAAREAERRRSERDVKSGRDGAGVRKHARPAP